MQLLRPKIKTILNTSLVLAGIFFLITNGLHDRYQNRMLPNTFIDDVRVEDLTREEALTLLQQSTPEIQDEKLITLEYQDVVVASTAAELGIHKDFESAVTNALAITHGQPYLTTLRAFILALSQENHISSTLSIDQEKAQQLIELFETAATQPHTQPSIQLETTIDGVVEPQVDRGVVGTKIAYERTVAALLRSLSDTEARAHVQIDDVGSLLSSDEVEHSRNRALALLDTTMQLQHAEEVQHTISGEEMIALLHLPDGYHRPAIEQLIATVAATVDRPAQEAQLTYDEETLAVEHFVPHSDGLTLEKPALLKQLVVALNSLEEAQESTDEPLTLPLPVITSQPTTLLGDTNTIGIQEQIGSGESRYHHSIPTRVHNVGLTASKIDNTIVAPGQEFSFNQALGDVSKATGFQPAYVIKGGKTELGDGGGVCQVSSTLFRALLDSGLEITRRIPHSYRVEYYELNSDPGFDATVYSGNIDLRFRNDTDNHILIHTTVDEPNRYMRIDLYGTADGRTTEVADYKQWGFAPAKPTEYFPDPTLPQGVKKQIDWGVSGLNTSFTHRVYDSDGNVMRENTYTSKYKSWSSKFLVGTQ